MQYFAIIVHIAILDSCGRGHISGIYPESIKVGVGGSTSSYIYIYILGHYYLLIIGMLMREVTFATPWILHSAR